MDDEHYFFVKDFPDSPPHHNSDGAQSVINLSQPRRDIHDDDLAAVCFLDSLFSVRQAPFT